MFGKVTEEGKREKWGPGGPLNGKGGQLCSGAALIQNALQYSTVNHVHFTLGRLLKGRQMRSCGRKKVDQKPRK